MGQAHKVFGFPHTGVPLEMAKSVQHPGMTTKEHVSLVTSESSEYMLRLNSGLATQSHIAAHCLPCSGKNLKGESEKTSGLT